MAQVPGFAEGGPGLPTGALTAITEAFEQGRDDLVLPATTPTPDGDGIMFADDAHYWFTRVAAERAPAWRNEVRFSGLLEPFRPIDHLTGTKVPLLLVVAPDDALTPPGPAIALAASTPMVEVVEIPGGHFAAYESAFTASSEAAVTFFFATSATADRFRTPRAASVGLRLRRPRDHPPDARSRRRSGAQLAVAGDRAEYPMPDNVPLRQVSTCPRSP